MVMSSRDTHFNCDTTRVIKTKGFLWTLLNAIWSVILCRFEWKVGMLLKCTCQERDRFLGFFFFQADQHNNVPAVTNSRKTKSTRPVSWLCNSHNWFHGNSAIVKTEGVIYGAAMKSFDSAITPHVNIMANLCYALVIKGTCLLLLSQNSHVKPITHQPNAVPSYILITIINSH